MVLIVQRYNISIGYELVEKYYYLCVYTKIILLM
jgi:hypothetical protein